MQHAHWTLSQIEEFEGAASAERSNPQASSADSAGEESSSSAGGLSDPSMVESKITENAPVPRPDRL